MDRVLEVNHLPIRFGEVVVLTDLSFSVAKGSSPSVDQNGAGQAGRLERVLADRNQQADADADRLIVAAPKRVIVCRLDIPAQPAIWRRPKHKVQRDFAGHRIGSDTVLRDVNPLGPDAEHEFNFLGEGPGFLEQEIRIPLCRVITEGWCNTELQFQPVLDWRHFRRNGGAETPSAPAKTPGRFGPQFEDCGRLLFWRLRGTRRIGSNL